MWWVVKGSHHGAPVAKLNKEYFTQPQALAVIAEISRAVGRRVVWAKRPTQNPTLVHHGKAVAAKWHVTTEAYDAVADLYRGTKQQAMRIARAFAATLGAPVRLLDNEGMPDKLTAHKQASFATNPLGRIGFFPHYSFVGGGDLDGAVTYFAGNYWAQPRKAKVLERSRDGIRFSIVGGAGGQYLASFTDTPERGIAIEKIREIDALHEAEGETNPSKRGAPKLNWNTYAGGTGAWEGANSYSADTSLGKWLVVPVTTRYGRRAGYLVQQAGPPLPEETSARFGLHSGLWKELGRVRSLNEGKKLAREVFEHAWYFAVGRELDPENWPKRNPYGPRSRFKHERLEAPGHFDSRSFRVKRSGRAEVVTACPKGKWDAKRKRCRAGTRAQALMTPRNPRVPIVGGYAQMSRADWLKVPKEYRGRYSRQFLPEGFEHLAGQPNVMTMDADGATVLVPVKFTDGNRRTRLDAFTRGHLKRWLDNHAVGRKREARAAIMRALSDDPEALERGAGWGELERRGLEMNPSALARAREGFKTWHEFAPKGKPKRMKGPPRKIPGTLVKLGDIVRIDYKSNKYTGKQTIYTHDTKKPRPVLTADPDLKHAYIVGGNMKITADGLIN